MFKYNEVIIFGWKEIVKVMNKPVDMRIIFDYKEKYPKSLRFMVSFDGDEEPQVIKIIGITGRNKEKINNTICLRYLCKIQLNGIQQLCEILYDLMKTTRILHKI